MKLVRNIPMFLFILFSSQACNEQAEQKKDAAIDGKKDFAYRHKDFEAFYNRFINDSVFQLSHTIFPVKGNYQSYDEERNWTKEDWPLIRFDMDKAIQHSPDSISVIQDSARFFFGNYCLDCGFSYEMEFRKFNGQWKLVYRQENNY